MNFTFYLGTKVYFGLNCLGQNGSILKKYGEKAFIVTGATSARVSGALDDVTGLLDAIGTKYRIYDKIENNPSLENVRDGAIEARNYDPDYVIGIGGGSPLDAAKAIAVLAVNDMEPVDLYKNSFSNTPLPVVAIPTTAGTGSEVTPYSILTRKDLQTKMSFGNEQTFPRVAFIDARYTSSMNRQTTVNTAIDAFSHALEGYLGKRSTPTTDLFALEAISIFGQCLPVLKESIPDIETRQKLLYMSMLGGMVISHTGTTIVHGMGYSLTYFKGIPHGRANGFLLKEYLNYNYDFIPDKIKRVLNLLGVEDIEAFGKIIKDLIPEKLSLDDNEIKLYASLTMKQKSTAYNSRPVSEEDLVEIYRASCDV